MNEFSSRALQQKLNSNGSIKMQLFFFYPFRAQIFQLFLSIQSDRVLIVEVKSNTKRTFKSKKLKQFKEAMIQRPIILLQQERKKVSNYQSGEKNTLKIEVQQGKCLYLAPNIQMININILLDSQKMINSNWHWFEFQNQLYLNYLSLQYPHFNDHLFSSLYQLNPNPQFETSPCEIPFKSPTFLDIEIQVSPNSIPNDKRDQNDQLQQQNSKNQRKMQYIGRNDFSNMFKSFLYLTYKCEKTKNHIRNLIRIKNFPISLNSFINKLKRKFPDCKTYIGPKQVRRFFTKLSKDEFTGQSIMGLLLKILLRQFLQKEYKLYIIKKYKGKNQSKKQIFRKCRILYNQVFHQEN